MSARISTETLILKLNIRHFELTVKSNACFNAWMKLTETNYLLMVNERSNKGDYIEICVYKCVK